MAEQLVFPLRPCSDDFSYVRKNIVTVYDYENSDKKTRKVNLQTSTKTSDGRIIPLIKNAEDILNGIKSNGN